MKPLFFALAVLVFVNHLVALPTPPHAKLRLQLPASAMIGEEIAAALIIENTGDTPFAITRGGDYRSTGYPQRMKVRVQDENHNDLPKLPPEAYGWGGGGLVGTINIAPGKTAEVAFPLECYVSFKTTGLYHVTASHDLGWKTEAGQPLPFAQASLTITEPAEAQATAHVEKLFASRPPAPSDSTLVFGYNLRFEKQLSVLRHPAYLPVLTTRAQAGSTSAVAGIGHIATLEATSTLIQLLEHTSTEVVIAASQQLLRRLPSFEDPTKSALHGWAWSRHQIDPLLPATWNPRFQDDIMEAAVKLIAHAETDAITAAARIITARGGPEQAPAVLGALQKALDVYHAPRTGSNANTLDAPKPQQTLIHTLASLRARGWRTQPGDAAQTLAWYYQLADASIPRPEDPSWQSRVQAGIENGPAASRIAALLAVPQTMPQAFEGPVLRALADPDWGVMRVACEVAGKSELPVFAPRLVQIVETAQEGFLHRSAVQGAIACGARLELWHALANTLQDDSRLTESLGTLITSTIDLPKSNGSNGRLSQKALSLSEREAIRDAWHTFLDGHRITLSEGKRIKLTDAGTIAELTGMNFRPNAPAIQIHFPDGTRWPARQTP